MKDIQKIKEFFSKPLNEEETAIDMAKERLDALGVKYKMSGNNFKPFEAIYRPNNKSNEFYDKFNRIVWEFNLGSAVKQLKSMDESKSSISDYKVGDILKFKDGEDWKVMKVKDNVG